MTRASVLLATSPFLFQASLVAALIGFGLFFDRTASDHPPVAAAVAPAPVDLATTSPEFHHDPAPLPLVVMDEDERPAALDTQLPDRGLTRRPS